MVRLSIWLHDCIISLHPHLVFLMCVILWFVFQWFVNLWFFFKKCMLFPLLFVITIPTITDVIFPPFPTENFMDHVLVWFPIYTVSEWICVLKNIWPRELLQSPALPRFQFLLGVAVAGGSFDAGARFGAGATPNIPPPPPGNSSGVWLDYAGSEIW